MAFSDDKYREHAAQSLKWIKTEVRCCRCILVLFGCIISQVLNGRGQNTASVKDTSELLRSRKVWGPHWTWNVDGQRWLMMVKCQFWGSTLNKSAEGQCAVNAQKISEDPNSKWVLAWLAGSWLQWFPSPAVHGLSGPEWILPSPWPRVWRPLRSMWSLHGCLGRCNCFMDCTRELMIVDDASW